MPSRVLLQFVWYTLSLSLSLYHASTCHNLFHSALPAWHSMTNYHRSVAYRRHTEQHAFTTRHTSSLYPFPRSITRTGTSHCPSRAMADQEQPLQLCGTVHRTIHSRTNPVCEVRSARSLGST